MDFFVKIKMFQNDIWNNSYIKTCWSLLDFILLLLVIAFGGVVDYHEVGVSLVGEACTHPTSGSLSWPAILRLDATLNVSRY